METFRRTGLKINLQLFAEKTEKPTAKRRQKAARKGQVARSAEINSVIVLLVTFLIVKAFTPYIIHEWTVLTKNIYELSSQNRFAVSNTMLQSIFLMVVISATKMLTPVVGGAMVGGLAASFVQVGMRFDMSAVSFNLNHINPVAGIRRLFSPQSLFELPKSFIKMMIVSYVAYLEYKKEFNNFPRLMDMNLQASSAYIGQVTMNLIFKVIVWLIILAIADYIFQRWRNEKQLKMSKDEVKEEYKQTEGDPQIKAKIKQKQRQLSMARMMQALPKADVVITNPTHFAVAIQYDAGKMHAPIVIAKGQDRMALRIKEVAKEHNITIVENKPLAQSLYHSTEIGDTIPEELFQAVAEVLAFVYKLKGKI